MIDYIKIHDEKKQVSLTGTRALALMAALMESPKNFEEISQFLQNCGISTRDYSIDTIRIDINTLKKAGFKISKATKNNNHKYGLLYNPLSFTPTSDEISAIKTVYRKLTKKTSPEILYAYHTLFKKIASKISDSELKEQVLGISVLKSLKLNLLEELVMHEKNHNRIEIIYQSSADTKHVYDITIEKIGLRSDKLYIYCYNHSTGERAFLNVSKIKSIISSSFDGNSSLGMDVIVKFKLDNYKSYSLEDNELIVEEKGDSAIINAKYFNEFIAIQRILSFSSDCTVIETEDIKEKIINKLKEMRAIYE